MMRAFLLCSAAVAIFTTLAPAQSDAAAFATILSDAQAKAADKDFDGALLVLDKGAEKFSGHAPFRYYRGLYSLEYARQAIASKKSVGLIDGLFADAKNNLAKAVELDGTMIAARLRLAEACAESGDAARGAVAAEGALSQLATAGDSSQADRQAALKLRAILGMRVYVAARQAGKDAPKELVASRKAFGELEKANGLDAALCTSWSTLEQWAGNNDAAYGIHVRAMQRNPKDQATMGGLVTVARAAGKAHLALAQFEGRRDALSLWYRGMLELYSSYEKPFSDPAKALAQLQRAEKSFAACAAGNPAYARACNTWQATAIGCQGFRKLAAKDFEGAEKLFLAAAAKDINNVYAKIDGQRNVINGLQLVVHHHFTNRDLGAAIETLEAACAVIKDDAALSNNLGLFARDHGVRLHAQGKRAEAKRLFETSYRAYANTVRLEPKSVRQRNDLVVIRIYHLRKDVDDVPAILASCIEDGEAQLADDPPADKVALQNLQEAVGDAYENLGYYHQHYSHDLSAARQNIEKSLKFYPFRRRRGVVMLREIAALEAEKKK